MLVYHFVDPALQVEKRGQQNKGGFNFEILVLVLRVEENVMESLPAFVLLFWSQIIVAFKNCFDLYFHP